MDAFHKELIRILLVCAVPIGLAVADNLGWIP
jgi:hypothetical protein